MKVLMLVLAIIFTFVLVNVSSAVLTCNAKTDTGNCTAINVGDATDKGTCQISGVSITSFNIDIDGSTDGVTYYGLYDDITAIGNYSFSGKPFQFLRADIDAETSTSLTVDCIWVDHN